MCQPTAESPHAADAPGRRTYLSPLRTAWPQPRHHAPLRLLIYLAHKLYFAVASAPCPRCSPFCQSGTDDSPPSHDTSPPLRSIIAPRRFPKGDRKALWSRPQTRNPCAAKKEATALRSKKHEGGSFSPEAPSLASFDMLRLSYFAALAASIRP